MAALPPDLFQNFHRRVEEQPQAIAVDDGNRVLTYQELLDAALAVAATVKELLGSVLPEKPQAIGLLMDHGADAIVGMFGCVFAGRCYVPLDPSFPRKRLQQYLQQAEVECVLSQSHRLSFAKELVNSRTPLLVLEDIDDAARIKDDTQNKITELDPTLPAYLLYTSGSTGEPKGVWHDQRSLLRSVEHYQNDLNVTTSDQVALVLPLQYTPSVFCVFGGLLAGATVCPFDLRRNSVESMLHWLQEAQITLLYATPTIFRRYMRFEHSNSDFSQLRSVQLAGEPLYRSDLETYFAKFGEHFSLYNGMGTTETSCLTRYFITTLDDFVGDIVPIGKPYDDATIHMLDEAGQPITKDSASNRGEMRVQSAYLARGYWRNSALTEQSFTDDKTSDKRNYVTGDIISLDKNSNFIYHGRGDSQVKIQGQRVELAEIESTLLKLESVQEAVVLFNENAQPPLSAFITPTQALKPIRRELSDALPLYMVPKNLLALDSLPTNPSGKLDRTQLSNLPTETISEGCDISNQAPNDLEEAITLSAFRNALEKPELTINDDFFAFGGDSLAATALVLELANEGYTIEASSLIELPTAKKLAQVLQLGKNRNTTGIYQFPSSATSMEESPSLFLFPGQGMEPLTFTRLAEGVTQAKSVFCLDYETIVKGMIEQNSDSISELAQRCAKLLLTTSNQKRVLLGFSLGGAVAMEVARVLQQHGQPIEQLILLDCYSPISMQIRYLKRRYGRHTLFGLRTQHRPHAEIYTPIPGSVADTLERAAFKYRPRSLTVPILSIIKAGVHRPTLRFFDDYAQWRRLIKGNYQEAVITGDHNELIRSSSTDQVATQIDQWLLQQELPKSQ